ncbi:hypothetical protein [Fibrella forsythiae]|uniref:NADH dehydrogenase n=1 Tax=Fibrella forsythiae TaxID=2817061 RepID=A0ABS3JGX9_9BACT|nr:hypothetical protein [Fibrella forsythiae]MBO0949260.1 hypothetical protein [Fibrella forsythiae]
MKLLESARRILAEIRRNKQDNHETRLLIGSLLAKNINTSSSIQEAEFKVFSQFGDDGIIQLLINKLSLSSQRFVEFGVESYEESNTRFLLLNNNWEGLVIDGSKSHIDYIQKDPIYWRHDLKAVNSFVTAENINQLLSSNGFSGTIGLLSIDIDGNDYWVWKAITVVEAEVVIIEYNSLFGIDRPITTPYKADFVRTIAHHSNLYFGASLLALCDLGKLKGYTFVGCNQAGNNAYFVKDHLVDNLYTPTPEEGYRPARFREARDKNGDLSFAGYTERRDIIQGLPVVNTRNNQLEQF